MAQVASGRTTSKKALAAMAAIVLAMPSLTACTDPQTRSQIDSDASQSRAGLDSATQPSVPHKHYNPLTVSDRVWAGNTSLRMQRGVPLPEKFETSHGITLVSAEPMTIGAIMREVQKQTGIAIHLSEGVLKSGAAGRPQATSPQTKPAIPAGTRSSPLSNENRDASMANTMQIAYEGSLSGLLDNVAAYFGDNWHYDGSSIVVANFETKVFTVEALPGTEQVSEGMKDDTGSSSGGSGGSSGSSSSSQSSITQNSDFKIDFHYWEELEKVLTSMLGGVGTVVVSPSMGTVTVTTNPRTMQVVAEYMAEENQRVSRQIAVNVEIYSVSLTKGLDFNVAFNTALKRLADFSGNFSGASAPSTVNSFTGGGALSLAILNPSTHNGEITDVFSAINGLGDTTKVAKFPMITLNNRPISRRVGKDVSYVAQSTTNVTGSGTSSTFAGVTLTPGTVHQGFSVQLTPRLLDDGRILLQYSLSIVDVLAIESFNSATGTAAATGAAATGSSSIQLPTTSNRIFVQQSVLKSGSTLFLGGAEETDSDQSSQGVTDPTNYFLGGGISSNTTHTMLFFALTPQVIDTPHSEQE